MDTEIDCSGMTKTITMLRWRSLYLGVLDPVTFFNGSFDAAFFAFAKIKSQQQNGWFLILNHEKVIC